MDGYHAFLFSLAIILFYTIRAYTTQRNIPLPPGPPADPLIGHLRSIPTSDQHTFFYKLGQKYGDVIHLRILGKSLIVLNSIKAATDLLEKRSANYSDRPVLPIFQLMGMGDTLAFLRYGKEFRAQRRMAEQYFRKDRGSKEHHPIQTRCARTLVRDLLSTPEKRSDLLMRFSTSVIIEASYGHRIEDSATDRFLEIAGACGEASARCGPPGSTPVDLFPILQHFPSWFPGTFYGTVAKESWQAFRDLREYPFSRGLENIEKGTAKPSFLSSLIGSIDPKGLENLELVDRIKAVCGLTYVAGAETTAGTLSFFFLAMVLYPETQLEAQKEIDAIIGSDRLPELSDRGSLPYLECLVQEVFRWNPATPAGIPHRVLEDDVYNGMFIPKGSTVIANARAMTWDESTYKDPFKFEPKRFLPEPLGRGEPTTTAGFGFGRRICPGRYLATDSSWIAIATILAAISISRTIGEDGKEIIPDSSSEASGISSRPSPFLCSLKARNTISENLLEQYLVEI